jgi:hypothetical protein
MSNGNGVASVTIDVEEPIPGWIRFTPEETPPAPDQLPVLLERAMCDWLLAHASCKPRAALAIVSEGATLAIHLWYDESM